MVSDITSSGIEWWQLAGFAIAYITGGVGSAIAYWVLKRRDPP
jgi:hypothetical protein